ncbi:phage antirepressor KilAC domain-containing protein [Pediococcus pentosaceus]|uniref:phage antirepressor KilAC domain-containing protein n=1 Tax=Pediococcus pentosaceus TaxID=1255 RepID=UPI0018E16F3A|nr:phage antirepressor KilAC domain-containing protein [Pediococcus pentosaceus]MBF7104588.1 phage antirepressor KilAC domain-containing protein [Pediococcus pentosaceus]QQC62004.1 phage antirepressor KilAC domain-containing protein [Pediococcus pentosaceus]
MNELQGFNFEGNVVPIKWVNGQLMFDAETVAKSVGLVSSSKGYINVRWNRVNEYIDSAKSGRKIKSGDFITEPQMYRLAIKANNKTAERFQDWVTNEVLPSIRKHGAYMTDEKIEEALLNPDTIISLATQLKNEREGRLIAEQQVKEFQPKVSYYDKVLSNDALMTISLIAKDYGMSGAGMNKLLHELGVQYRQGGTWLLYAKYQRTGWTHSETKMVPRKDGTEKAVLNTKWTQKGRLGLYALLKDNGYLPLIEMKDESAV